MYCAWIIPKPSISTRSVEKLSSMNNCLLWKIVFHMPKRLETADIDHLLPIYLGKCFFSFLVFTFLLWATGEGASSLSKKLLTVSSATPILGPWRPGCGWARQECSHHLRRVLGSCTVWPGWSWRCIWCRGRIIARLLMVKDVTSMGSLAQAFLKKAVSLSLS